MLHLANSTNNQAMDQHASVTHSNALTMHSWVGHWPLGVGISPLLRRGQFPGRIGLKMEHLPVRVMRVELVALTVALIKEIL